MINSAKNIPSVPALLVPGLLGWLAACAAPPPPVQTPVPTPPPTEARAPAERRERPPPPAPMQALEFPGFQEVRLANGLQILVVEDRDLPLASMELYVKSGSSSDPVESAGLAEMVAELLSKGTTTRSAEEIATTIEGAGGSLNTFASADYLTVSAGALSESLPLVFELVSDVTLRPTFPEDELETARTRALSGLEVELSQPGPLADRRFVREVYGQGHPYSLRPLPETLEEIGRAGVEAFHQAHFTPGNALLVVSGDVNAARVEELAREHFGGWQGGGVPPVVFREPPAREDATIYLVHRPGSVQSNLLVGHVGIRPDNPDYYPLQVLNKIVGGGTDARLFLILREEKGWTYGAYSRFTRPADVGYYVASAEVRSEVTDSALAELDHQLRRVRREPVSEEELEAAKSYLIGSFPLRIQTPRQIAGQVAQTYLLGLPIEHLLRYRERVSEVTIEDVQRVAREYVRPERAVIVVVGDATQVLDDLDALGIAPIELYNTEGDRIERAAIEVRASTAVWDGSRLEPGALTYQFTVRGNPLGTTTSTLAREGDEWVATSAIESPVITRRSELRFGAAGLEPVSLTQTTAQQGTELNADLSFADGRITGTATLPGEPGGEPEERSVDAAVVQGTLLPGMGEYALAVADLAVGESITVPVFSAESGSVAPTTYQVTGMETVTVPAGEFPVFRVEVSGGQQPMTLYLRQESPHLVVKMELVGIPVTIELQSMQ